ncbi:MAG: DNA-binding protein, partial [Methylovulum sp.]|nr:DNA-binding protein [Methylovulum sp.]
MPKLTDTYARAYDCCGQILTELGRFPTIDLIRERIGVNSPTTIKKAMNEWTQHFAEQHFDKLHRPDIPVTLIHSVEQVWKLAVLEAEKAYLDKEKAYQQSLAEAQASIVEQQQEQQLLRQVLNDTESRLQQAGQQIQALQQALKERAQDQVVLLEKLSAHEKQLLEQEKLMQEQAERWQHQQ